MRQYVRPEARNAAHGLRGPDQAELTAAAATAAAAIAEGKVTPEAGVNQMTKAWNDIDGKTSPELRLRWRKLSAGVK